MATQSLPRHVELSAEGLADIGALTACDREPIHLSGAIQPHGMLLALDPATMRVAAASANLVRQPHWGPALLGARLEAAFEPRVAEVLRGLKDTITPFGALPVRVSLPAGTRGGGDYDVISHRRGGFQIVEFEHSSEGGNAEFLLNQYAVTKALYGADSVERLCEVAVREIRGLSGFDRVMIYRFDADAHGCVVAEARAEDAEPFLGLHYPATDIPRQARVLYLRNWIRVIPDVDYRADPLLALPETGGADRIDLSMAVLRSVSPYHLKYLQNMRVAATLTISIVIDNQLWGLIAVPSRRAPARGASRAPRLRGARPAARRPAEGGRTRGRPKPRANLEPHLRAGHHRHGLGRQYRPGRREREESLLAMVDADGVVLEIEGERISAGDALSSPCLDALLPWLAGRVGAGPQPWSTVSLAGESGLPIDPGACPTTAAGLMYLPLPGHARNFIAWFRGERAQTVRWAGRVDLPKDQSLEPLQPRASFSEWLEQVRDRSLPWRPEEIATATELAQAMPEVLMHRSQNRLARLALHDPLTGLPNRVYLLDKLEAALDPGKSNSRGRQGGVGMLFIDLDGFKGVNDTHGHEIGDELLRQVARRVSGLLRPQDFVARIGGDEFVVVVPGCGAQEANAIAQRILQAFRAPFPLKDQVSASVTASIGVANVAPGVSPAEALRQSDTAMYHAKRSGRDQTAEYDVEARATVSSRTLAVDELRRAIEAGEITPYYQPLWDVSRGGEPVLHGYEALARWRRPDGEVIAPGQFIALAEESGLIGTLGRSIFRQAVRDLRGWRNRQLSVAVNVSVRQLTADGFADSVLADLVELGIKPCQLCIEITETQVMQAPELSLAALKQLSKAGVSIAIDDFGIGYSSLAYVRDLPAAELKIDQRFVAGLPGNRKDRAVVRAVVELAHSLGMRTVAEGVETPEQLAMLRELGSDLVQGFLLGRPQPPETLLHLNSLGAGERRRA